MYENKKKENKKGENICRPNNVELIGLNPFAFLVPLFFSSKFPFLTFGKYFHVCSFVSFPLFNLSFFRRI